MHVKGARGAFAKNSLLIYLIAQVAMVHTAIAQSLERNRDYLSLLPFEQIDTSSGQLKLRFTDLAMTGNAGQVLAFERYFSNNGVQLFGQPPGTPQWHFGLAGMPMGVEGTSSQFRMADGSVVKPLALFDSGPVTDKWLVTAQLWRYDRYARRLYMPDGRILSYSGGIDENGKLVLIEDRFSNTISLEWGASLLTVRQKIGVGAGGADINRTFTIDLLPTGMPWRIRYEELDREWTYDYDPANWNVLRTVTGPNQTTWQYTYDGGVIKKVVTPLGGEVIYDYEIRRVYWGWEPGQFDEFKVLDMRHLGTDTWDFGYVLADQNVVKTFTVKPPSGGLVTYEYSQQSGAVSDGLTVEHRRVYRGSQINEAELLEHEQRFYTNLRIVERPGHTVPILSKRQISRPGEIARSIQYTYPLSYPHNYHRPATVTSSGTIARTTDYEYQHFVDEFAPSLLYIVGLPKKQTVRVGQGDPSITEWQYESETGFPLSETMNGLTTTFTPDDFGNVATVSTGTGADTMTSAYTYKYGQVASIVTNPATYQTAFGTKHDGTPLCVERRPAGASAPPCEGQPGPSVRRTTFQYDGLMRLTQVVAPGEGPVTTTYATAASRETVVTSGSGVVMPTVKSILDGFGRTIRSEQLRPDGSWTKVNVQYDGEGRQRFVSDPYVGDAQATGAGITAGTQFTYDVLGRVRAEIHTAEDNSQRVYDYSLNTVTVTDEEAHKTSITFDSFGDPADTRLKTLTDAAGTAWNYTYNTNGSMLTMSGGGATRQWAYDTRKLLESETHPESGTTTYTYDTAGRLAAKRDATVPTGSSGLAYTYDVRGRVTDVHANGALIRQVTYQAISDNPVSVHSPVEGVTTTFDYEPGTGRLSSRTDDVVGHPAFTVSYHYDGDGNLDRITYPSGRQVGYLFHPADNTVRAVVNVSRNEYYAKNFRYEPSGALQKYQLGDKNEVLLTYDERLRVKTITAAPLSLFYTYDRLGNVRTIQSTQAGNQEFWYDQLSRLTKAVGPYNTVEYKYDEHGNRQSNAFGSYNYIPGNIFRLQSYSPGPSGEMAYDLGGKLSGRGTQTFEYTPTNQLREIKEDGSPAARFLYDGDDWRVKKVADGLTTYSIRGPNGQLLHEKVINNSTGATEMRDYIYAGSRLIAVVKGAP